MAAAAGPRRQPAPKNMKVCFERWSQLGEPQPSPACCSAVDPLPHLTCGMSILEVGGRQSDAIPRTEWRRVTDRSTQQSYYVNLRTRQTQWHAPPAVDLPVDRPSGHLAMAGMAPPSDLVPQPVESVAIADDATAGDALRRARLLLGRFGAAARALPPDTGDDNAAATMGLTGSSLPHSPGTLQPGSGVVVAAAARSGTAGTVAAAASAVGPSLLATSPLRRLSPLPTSTTTASGARHRMLHLSVPASGRFAGSPQLQATSASLVSHTAPHDVAVTATHIPPAMAPLAGDAVASSASSYHSSSEPAAVAISEPPLLPVATTHRWRSGSADAASAVAAGSSLADDAAVVLSLPFVAAAKKPDLVAILAAHVYEVSALREARSSVDVRSSPRRAGVATSCMAGVIPMEIGGAALSPRSLALQLSGRLQKKSRGGLRSWLTRFFVTHRWLLIYYGSDGATAANPSAVIDLRCVSEMRVGEEVLWARGAAASSEGREQLDHTSATGIPAAAASAPRATTTAAVAPHPRRLKLNLSSASLAGVIVIPSLDAMAAPAPTAAVLNSDAWKERAIATAVTEGLIPRPQASPSSSTYVADVCASRDVRRLLELEGAGMGRYTLRGETPEETDRWRRGLCAVFTEYGCAAPPGRCLLWGAEKEELLPRIFAVERGVSSAPRVSMQEQPQPPPQRLDRTLGVGSSVTSSSEPADGSGGAAAVARVVDDHGGDAAGSGSAAIPPPPPLSSKNDNSSAAQSGSMFSASLSALAGKLSRRARPPSSTSVSATPAAPAPSSSLILRQQQQQPLSAADAARIDAYYSMGDSSDAIEGDFVIRDDPPRSPQSRRLTGEVPRRGTTPAPASTARRAYSTGSDEAAENDDGDGSVLHARGRLAFDATQSAHSNMYHRVTAPVRPLPTPLQQQPPLGGRSALFSASYTVEPLAQSVTIAAVLRPPTSVRPLTSSIISSSAASATTPAGVVAPSNGAVVPMGDVPVPRPPAQRQRPPRGQPPLSPSAPVATNTRRMGAPVVSSATATATTTTASSSSSAAFAASDDVVVYGGAGAVESGAMIRTAGAEAAPLASSSAAASAGLEGGMPDSESSFAGAVASELHRHASIHPTFDASEMPGGVTEVAGRTSIQQNQPAMRAVDTPTNVPTRGGLSQRSDEDVWTTAVRTAAGPPLSAAPLIRTVPVHRAYLSSATAAPDAIASSAATASTISHGPDRSGAAAPSPALPLGGTAAAPTATNTASTNTNHVAPTASAALEPDTNARTSLPPSGHGVPLASTASSPLRANPPSAVKVSSSIGASGGASNGGDGGVSSVRALVAQRQLQQQQPRSYTSPIPLPNRIYGGPSRPPSGGATSAPSAAAAAAFAAIDTATVVSPSIATSLSAAASAASLVAVKPPDLLGGAAVGGRAESGLSNISHTKGASTAAAAPTPPRSSPPVLLRQTAGRGQSVPSAVVAVRSGGGGGGESDIAAFFAPTSPLLQIQGDLRPAPPRPPHFELSGRRLARTWGQLPAPPCWIWTRRCCEGWNRPLRLLHLTRLRSPNCLRPPRPRHARPPLPPH